jgi:hypothetical protein
MKNRYCFYNGIFGTLKPTLDVYLSGSLVLEFKSIHGLRARGSMPFFDIVNIKNITKLDKLLGGA